jgi:hypothetical protein
MTKRQDPKAKKTTPRTNGKSKPAISETPETVAVQTYGDGIDDAVAERICELIEETPKGLDHICDSDMNLVSARTFHRWLEISPSLRQRYARAKERQADFLAAEIIRIADTPHRGIKKKTDNEGNEEITEGDMIEHRRLQVDARKWYAGKLAPKKYGDKVEVEQSGEIKHTISFKK